MKHERTTLCKLHIGFSRALHYEMHIFKQTIAGATQKLLDEKIANAKPAPSSAPVLIGRPGEGIHIFARNEDSWNENHSANTAFAQTVSHNMIKFRRYRK